MRKIMVFPFLFTLLFLSIYLHQQILITFEVPNDNLKSASAGKIYFYFKNNMTLIGKLLVEDVFKENCTNDFVFSDGKVLKVLLPDTTEASIETYKAVKTKEFIDKTVNPFEKSKISVTLQPYEDESDFPDPASRLFDSKESIDDLLINKNLKDEKEQRLQLGDTDLLQIKEVQDEFKNRLFSVSNIVHFIWFGCREFRVMNYMCVLSAFRYQKPKLILFHTDCEPSGEYWTALKHIIGDRLKVVRRSPPQRVWNIPIKVIEHKADVARLQIELEVGGIYIDTDVVILKPVDELRKYKLVLAEEQQDGLTNAIILANRKSWFLRRWYWEYRYFKDEEWGFNSVLVPWSIATLFPDEIYAVKKLMCRPNYREVDLIYRELYDWHSNYMMHMYNRFRLKSDGKKDRTLKELAVLNTTFGQIYRYIIWGDENSRNLYKSIIKCNLTETLLDAYYNG